MSGPAFDVVVAADERLGIGKGGELPWRLKGEMRHFRELTRGVAGSEGQASPQNAVIMGRRTWESIPAKFRPLPQRVNVVITKRADYPLPDGVARAASLDDALTKARDLARGGGLFVIGGASVYKEAVVHPGCESVYLTRVLATFDCDAFFPDIEGRFERGEILAEASEGGVSYRIERWRRRH